MTLDQSHVARWVKEVDSQPVLAKNPRSSLPLARRSAVRTCFELTRDPLLRCWSTLASSVRFTSKFSTTASMTQSASWMRSRSSSKFPILISPEVSAVNKAGGRDWWRPFKAFCGDRGFGWRGCPLLRGPHQAVGREPRRSPDARRSGNPWFRRRVQLRCGFDRPSGPAP